MDSDRRAVAHELAYIALKSFDEKKVIAQAQVWTEERKMLASK